MHRFDVWCFFERSRTFDPAVGLGTSISGVEVPPPELRKVAHIPPTVTLDKINLTRELLRRLDPEHDRVRNQDGRIEIFFKLRKTDF